MPRAGSRGASLLQAYPDISAAVEVEDPVLAGRARHSYKSQVGGSIRRQSGNSRQAGSGNDGELVVSSLAQTDALANLLIEKGLITEVEFMRSSRRTGSGTRRCLIRISARRNGLTV